MSQQRTGRAARALLFTPDRLPAMPVVADFYPGASGPFTAAAKHHGMVVAFACEPDRAAFEAYAANHDVPAFRRIPEGQPRAALPKLNFVFGKLPPTNDEFDAQVLPFLRINRVSGAILLSRPSDPYSGLAVEHASYRMEQLGLGINRVNADDFTALVAAYSKAPAVRRPLVGSARGEAELARALVGELLRAVRRAG